MNGSFRLTTKQLDGRNPFDLGDKTKRLLFNRPVFIGNNVDDFNSYTE